MVKKWSKNGQNQKMGENGRKVKKWLKSGLVMAQKRSKISLNSSKVQKLLGHVTLYNLNFGAKN